MHTLILVVLCVTIKLVSSQEVRALFLQLDDMLLNVHDLCKPNALLQGQSYASSRVLFHFSPLSCAALSMKENNFLANVMKFRTEIVESSIFLWQPNLHSGSLVIYFTDNMTTFSSLKIFTHVFRSLQTRGQFVKFKAF